jgi:hypothetical protein
VEDRGTVENASDPRAPLRYARGQITVTGGLWGAAASTLVSATYIVVVFVGERMTIDSAIVLILTAVLFICAPIGGVIGLIAAGVTGSLASRNTVVAVLIGSMIAYAIGVPILLVMGFVPDVLAGPLVALAVGAPLLLALNVRIHRITAPETPEERLARERYGYYP